MEAIVRAGITNPAIIALLDDKIHVGLNDVELERLANMELTRKISLQGFGIALAGLGQPRVLSD